MRGYLVAQMTRSLRAGMRHVRENQGDCSCELCRGGYDTPAEIARGFPAGWAHETPEEKAAAVRAASRR